MLLSLFLLVILISILRVQDSCFGQVDLMDYGTKGNVQRQRILDMHNMLRSYEAGGGWGGGAVYMLRLTYDIALESYAKNYARKLCDTGHWGHSKQIPPNRVAPGENLYVNTIDYSKRGAPKFDGSVVVKKWWDERKYFDWNAKDPSLKAKKMNQMIGHYTQVVRAEASAVGCWIITGCQCKNRNGCKKENNPPYWSTYMACHYDFGNQGWFPYWPVAIPSKIPSSIPQERRRRCGNCPKGFGTCGTTSGHLNPKRDAYLCVGYWDKSKPLPQANLLSESIKQRKLHSLPSWAHMIRYCDNSGGCSGSGGGAGAMCWDYTKGDFPHKEPRILFQQCLCKSFSTKQGTWYQRDTCSIHRKRDTAQPLTRYGVLQLQKPKLPPNQQDAMMSRNDGDTRVNHGKRSKRFRSKSGYQNLTQLSSARHNLGNETTYVKPYELNETDSILRRIAAVERAIGFASNSKEPTGFFEIDGIERDGKNLLFELNDSKNAGVRSSKQRSTPVLTHSGNFADTNMPDAFGYTNEKVGSRLLKELREEGRHETFKQKFLSGNSFHPAINFLKDHHEIQSHRSAYKEPFKAPVTLLEHTFRPQNVTNVIDENYTIIDAFPNELTVEHDLTDAGTYPTLLPIAGTRKLFKIEQLKGESHGNANRLV